jgi:hypothetical protein
MFAYKHIYFKILNTILELRKQFQAQNFNK